MIGPSAEARPLAGRSAPAGYERVEICRQLRGARVKTPIIVLSAVGDEVDKVLLLEIGADDYVVKPFGSRGCWARIRALLRTGPDARQVIHFADTGGSGASRGDARGEG
jgi:DNA-binding response OmpR family regulator